MSSRPELRLDWCSHEAAKYACEKWHYSRCVPNQKTVKVGVWEDTRFVGCVLFGDGANAGMFDPYGLDYTQGCELVRIALGTHYSHVSRIIKIAMLFLRKACPKIRLVVSFADPEQGHCGGVYKAGGWLYAGMTSPADEYIVNGTRMHGRALRSTRSTHKHGKVDAPNVFEWAKKVLDPKATKIPGSSKHRYLMPLDDEMRQRIEPLRKPYPKRERSAENGTPGIQSGGGGVNPTRSLQVTGGKEE